ncbi:DUF6470 family protein [Gorillibacterium massiliense]|uniref:DUF6470 family protein n=1 Tax=Gorillibacterium massiliense TaxID=1280390 RepID=UPI0004B71F7B|nr:DUF6470 family protein [Gorillibacterium massiliense]
MSGIGSLSSAYRYADRGYQPADMEIRMRQADIQVDMQQVYEDWGLKKPSTFSREMAQEDKAKYMENLAYKVEEGRRLGNIRSGEKNVAGHMAHERYMRNGSKELTIEALPREGPRFDVRIYPPEIQITPKGVLPK